MLNPVGCVAANATPWIGSSDPGVLEAGVTDVTGAVDGTGEGDDGVVMTGSMTGPGDNRAGQ